MLAEDRGCRFTYEHRGEGSVALEAKWMRQVLLNLLTNAIHASPAGGRISVRSVLSDGLWRVAVEDEGRGVTPAERERIFERFVRLPSPSHEYQGSGLGLAICKSIVELHGGRISATAGANGRGLRIEIEIPALSTVEAPEEAAVPKPLIHSSGELLH